MERTILLVDDEPNIIRSLVRLLRRDQYNILTANSGKEGLEVLKDNNVGVIVSDQRMPEMTGVEFLSKVKEIYPETVRIVLSGYTDLKSVTDAINHGAIYRFLTKPWEDDLLRENIKDAFAQFELVSENTRLADQLQEANIELEAINRDLERQVELKTREVMSNMRAMQVSQDILDNMPVAVIGIADDGTIALANLFAKQWLNSNEVEGRFAREVFPSPITEICGQDNSDLVINKNISLNNEVEVDAYCHKLETSSDLQGRILIMVPSGKT